MRIIYVMAQHQSANQIFTYNGSYAYWQTPTESNTSGTATTTDATVSNQTYVVETSGVGRWSDTGPESASYVLKGR